MGKFRAGLMPRLAAMMTCGALAVSPAIAATVDGSATEVATNVVHPNGNIYDQVLLTGASATVTADPGQVTRISFIDLNDDIVQVEFSGAGSLTLVLADNGSGPALATKYNQPGVLYMKGHATVAIQNSDATTHVAIFSVGRLTAQNPAIFRPGEMYDGIADLARLSIIADPTAANGSTFGGIRAGNAQFWGVSGVVGITAANVHVQGPVVISDVWAVDAATPALVFGLDSRFPNLVVAGGDLAQPNGKTINATGGYFLNPSMQAGATSHNVPLPAQPLRGEFYYGFIITTAPDQPGL